MGEHINEASVRRRSGAFRDGDGGLGIISSYPGGSVLPPHLAGFTQLSSKYACLLEGMSL
jgi:hypothetical protein